jgi:pyruvate/2-oxoglutarate dehydrogenase complex dihydrolipoamide acyltransferase (E2) component
MGAVCPTCGIAVVPGYVRCPKCQAALPAARRPAPAQGGTSVAGWSIPRGPAIAVGVLLGIVIVVAVAHHGSHAAPPAAKAAAAPGAQAAAPAAPADDIAPAPAAAGSAAPDPVGLANQLGAELQRQELWSTVEVVGNRVEVRSSACRDPAMGAALAQASPGFKAAGLTTLRCVEQSGVVVFTHNL